MKHKNITLDSIEKSFWKMNRRFVSLMNAVYHDGKQVIQEDDVQEQDTDISNVVITHEQIQSLSRRRDIVKKIHLFDEDMYMG